MTMSPEQEALVGRVFESYVTEHHLDDLQQLITDENEEMHRPVVVNAMTLFEANMEVGDFFNSFPNEVLLVFDAVLQKKAVELLNNSPHRCKGDEWRMRHSLHARMTGLPVCPELTRHTIPRSRDVGHFLSVTGTVIRTSIAKVLEFERDYLCSKCRYVFKLKADFDQFYTFTAPISCPNPAGCNSFKFSCLSGGSEPAVCRDYQEIKIQEQVQRLSVGSIPRSLVVVLEDDLVDSCKSGDDVTVYGVMRLRWKPLYDGAQCDVELVLKANNVEVNNQQMADALLIKDVQKEFEEFWSSYEHDPIAGRNQILLSLCPQVFGMYVVKLAVAMVLAGGVQRVDPSGTKIRGECHLLLVGDPGTGKSQFLKYAAKIVSRSVLTAGIGSTSAGLTVAAVKDGGDWHLEAGALVLSDGGLCCIDEFSSIKEHDRISIHEAMEQQSISVAKAGMVCKLNTRTTILAATNPKGQYDSNEPLSVNVALASPLLSRFDLVLVLLDTRNADWDRIISTFILEDRGPPAESSSLWSMEKMRAYFSLVKHLQPQMSDQANCILTRYYQLQRQSDSRNAARTTIRMLESLSRLAEGHARLMFRETVTIEDAVMAVSVMECSMQGGALLGNVNTLLTSFPADPVQQYQTQCRVLLAGLDLPLLLRQEMGRLSRMRTNLSQDTHRGSPSAGDQHHLSSPESINQTQDLHIAPESINQTSNPDFRGCVAAERTLNWFPTISSTPAPQRTTSFVTTPDQKVKQNSNTSMLTGTEEDGSELHRDIFRSLEKERRSGKKGNTKEKLPKCLEEIQPSEELEGRSSSELFGSKNLVLEDRSTNDDCRLTKKDQAETPADLMNKLSGFMFKPRKTIPSVLNVAARSEMKTLKRSGNDGLVSSLTNPRKRKQNTDVGSAERMSTSKTLCLSSFREDNVLRRDTAGEKETGEGGLDHQRIRIHLDGVSEQVCPCSPPPNQRTSKSDQIRTNMSSSALAKLSRFSFTCRTEPKAADPTSAGPRPPQLDNGKSWKVNQDSNQAKKFFTGDLNPNTNEVPKTFPNINPSTNEALKIPENMIQPNQPGAGLTAGEEHSTEPTTQPIRKQEDLNDDPASSRRTVNLKKRKCFHLGPSLNGARSSSLFSGPSLFGSSEFSMDDLDTDWDQEVSKTSKV